MSDIERDDEGTKRPGRPKGSTNRVTADVRAMINQRGRPLEFLCDVARGKKIRVGAQAGPEPTFVYPDLDTRIRAAEKLLDKIAPTMKSQEVTGADGGPLEITDPYRASLADMTEEEINKRLAELETKAARPMPLSKPLPPPPSVDDDKEAILPRPMEESPRRQPRAGRYGPGSKP